jgi:hypothetical protein
MCNTKNTATFMAAALALCAGSATGDDAAMQKQIDEVRGALPKFAIPMREVGDRFQNMYFAAKDGNWALAAICPST